MNRIIFRFIHKISTRKYIQSEKKYIITHERSECRCENNVEPYLQLNKC